MAAIGDAQGYAGVGVDGPDAPCIIYDAHFIGDSAAWHGRQLRVLEGEVVVITGPKDFARMRQGAILVAPATNPAWTPLFTLAVGVIVEIGGTLSHASIVAREYGLPALANVKDATKLLRDGDRVRLDAVNGTVEILLRSDLPVSAQMDETP